MSLKYRSIAGFLEEYDVTFSDYLACIQKFYMSAKLNPAMMRDNGSHVLLKYYELFTDDTIKCLGDIHPYFFSLELGVRSKTESDLYHMILEIFDLSVYWRFSPYEISFAVIHERWRTYTKHLTFKELASIRIRKEI